MPIGVPRIVHLDRHEETSQWLDLYNKLYRERFLFLGADLDDELANQLLGLMMFLHQENPIPDMYLLINSLGGTMVGGLGIYDFMSTIDTKVKTICVGIAASMACFLLSTGHAKSRFALPHSRIMIHEPVAGTKGKGYDVALDLKQIDRLRTRVNEVYCSVTGQNYITIYTDMKRDNWMRAKAAKAYGILDSLIYNPKLDYISRKFQEEGGLKALQEKFERIYNAS